MFFLEDISTILAYQGILLSEKYRFLSLMCFFLHLPTLRACALEKMWHKAFSFGEDILVDSSQGDFCQSGSVSISQTVHSWGGYHYTTPLVNKHS